MAPALAIETLKQNNSPVGVGSPNRCCRLPLPTPRIPGDGPQPPKGGDPPIPVLGAALLVRGGALGPGAKGRTRRVAPPKDGAERRPLHAQVRHAPQDGHCAHPQLSVVQEQLRTRGVPEAVPTARQQILHPHGPWGDSIHRLQQAHFANPVAAVLGMREGGNRRSTPPSHDRCREPALRARAVLRVLSWLPVRSPAGPAPTSAGSHHQIEKGWGRQNKGGGGAARSPYPEAPLLRSSESLARCRLARSPPPPPGKVVSVGNDRVDSHPSPTELLVLSKTDFRARSILCQR